MTPDISMVNSLSEIAFLNDQTILNNLKSELPQYIVKAAETSPEVDVMSWWVEHSDELPHWSAAAKMVALIQPSSGAVERVFSILTDTFSTQQDSSLQDYIEASSCCNTVTNRTTIASCDYKVCYICSVC